MRERREEVRSQSYEEIIFNEPTEQLYEVMTTEPKGRGKGAKGFKQGRKEPRTAELPAANSEGNPYSQRSEAAEIERLMAARRTVEKMIAEEKKKLGEREKVMEELSRKSHEKEHTNGTT